jgi:hypothetical protein
MAAEDCLFIAGGETEDAAVDETREKETKDGQQRRQARGIVRGEELRTADSELRTAGM